MKAQAQFLILSLCIMLGACSMFQTPVPKTFNQSALYAGYTIQSLDTILVESYNAGYVTSTKAAAINQKLIEATEALQLANELHKESPTDPEAAKNLEKALSLLEWLQAELEARQ